MLVGNDAEDQALEPWSLVQGTWEDIKSLDAISADDTYFDALGINGINDTAQIATGRVKMGKR